MKRSRQSGWRKFKMRELFRIKHGYAFKSEFFTDSGEHILLTPGNFNDEGGFKLKGEKEKYYAGPIPTGYVLQRSDLLVAMTEQAEGLLGSSALVPKGDRYLHNQRLGLVTDLRTEAIHRHFLYFLFNTRGVRSQIRGSASGVKIRHTSPERIGEVDVTIPPVAQQATIASILSAYDDLIENNTRRIQILEQMAQALYREWFVYFRFPDFAKASSGRPGHAKVKRVASPLGPIPQGWEVLKLSSLVETQYGYTESAASEPVGPRYLRGMDINKTSYIEWDSVPYCPISSKDYPRYKLSIGDILVIRMADPGRVGIVEQEVDAVFASYLIRLKIRSNRLSPTFLFHFLRSERYVSYIMGACTGTTRKSASSSVVTDIDVVVPATLVRERFDSEVGALRQLLTVLIRKNATLRRTRDLLLPKLISGALDVSKLGLETA